MSADDCFIMNITSVFCTSDCIFVFPFFCSEKNSCGFYYLYYNNKFDNNLIMIIIFVIIIIVNATGS